MVTFGFLERGKLNFNFHFFLEIFTSFCKMFLLIFRVIIFQEFHRGGNADFVLFSSFLPCIQQIERKSFTETLSDWFRLCSDLIVVLFSSILGFNVRVIFHWVFNEIVHNWMLNSGLAECKFAHPWSIVRYLTSQGFFDFLAHILRFGCFLLTFVFYVDCLDASFAVLVISQRLVIIWSDHLINWCDWGFLFLWNQFFHILLNIKKFVFHVFVEQFAVYIGGVVGTERGVGCTVFNVFEWLLDGDGLVGREKGVVIERVFPIDFVRCKEGLLFGFEIDGMGVFIGGELDGSLPGGLSFFFHLRVQCLLILKFYII